MVDHGVEEVEFDIEYTTMCVGRGVKQLMPGHVTG